MCGARGVGGEAREGDTAKQYATELPPCSRILARTATNKEKVAEKDFVDKWIVPLAPASNAASLLVYWIMFLNNELCAM